MENLIKERAIFKGYMYVCMYVCMYLHIIECYVSSHHVASYVLYTKDTYLRNEEKLEIVIHYLLLLICLNFVFINSLCIEIDLFSLNFQTISCIVIFAMYPNRSKLPSNPSWLSEGKSGLLEQSVSPPYHSIKIN